VDVVDPERQLEGDAQEAVFEPLHRAKLTGGGPEAATLRNAYFTFE
jgi:hypothetical protein